MSFKSILTSTRPISLQSHSKEKQINKFYQSVKCILATEKENMFMVTGKSIDNLVGGHEHSGEGSEKEIVSQRFLQIHHNRFVVQTLKPQFPS